MDKTSDAYKSHLANAGKRQRQQTRAGQDIGPLPEIVDAARRASCRDDLRRYLQTYESATFNLPFSPSHDLIIEHLQHIALKGGTQVLVAPRGSGKSSMTEAAGRWAILYGHRKWIVLISDNEEAAKEMLESCLSEFENNDLLYDDFPEACHPYRALEGESRKCNGQRLDGARTKMKLGAKTFRLPVIDGSLCSGSRISCVGYGGRIRGLKQKMPDGSTERPDFVIIDDPAKDEQNTTEKRLKTLEKGILGLGGPGKKIACAVLATVLERGDYADTLRDKRLHPEWRAISIQAMESMPERMDLWEQWHEIDTECYGDDDHEPAHQFVRDNYDAMHEGASHYWPERVEPGDVSAVESAMRVYFNRREAFFCELQNDPEVSDAVALLDAPMIMRRTSGLPAGIVPNDATHLTVGIDCHANALYYVVTAWNVEDFSGWLVRYGAYPDQKRRFFKLHDAPRPLGKEAQQHGYATAEGILYYGIMQTLLSVCQSYALVDGGTIAINQGLIDAGWQTDTVYAALQADIRATAQDIRPTGNLGYDIVVPSHAPILPSFGRGIRATMNELNAPVRKKRKGEQRGRQWYTRTSVGKPRHCVFDANHWKTFIRDRLVTPIGEPGGLVLFGDDPRTHEMLAAHILAEMPQTVMSDSRTVEEWKLRPGGPDNHLFDCLVLSAVAASIAGVHLPGETIQAARRPRKTYTPPSHSYRR